MECGILKEYETADTEYLILGRPWNLGKKVQFQ
jgi:hypothetical protein